MATEMKKRLRVGLKNLFRHSTDPQPDQRTNNPTLPTNVPQIPIGAPHHTQRNKHAIKPLQPLDTIDLAGACATPVKSTAQQREIHGTQATANLSPPTAPNTLENSTAIPEIDLKPIQSQPKSLKLVDEGNMYKIWDRLKMDADALSKVSSLFGPLREAFSPFFQFVETLQNISESYEGYEDLKMEVAAIFDVIRKHDDASTSPAIAACIAELGQNIAKELDAVDRNKRSSEMSRLWNAEHDTEQLRKCYERIQRHVQTFTANARINEWNSVIQQETETLLKGLPNSPAALYRSAKASELGRNGCILGTRLEVLEQMHAWAQDLMSEKVYWLNGMAGTGKTTIAYSLCQRLEKDQKLGASFFCSRQLPECRDVNRIVPSISYQLSRLSLLFRDAVSLVLKANPDVHNQSVFQQFQDLVVQPISQISDTLPAGLVVVVDALDECDGEAGISEILETLLSFAASLPLKFLVASRPDAPILDRMRSRHGEGINTEMRLHELAHPTVQKDIRTYLTTKFESRLAVSEIDLDTLVERSGVLFIYAATVVRYVSSKNFARGTTRLAEVLGASVRFSNESTKAIDTLYTTILETAFNDEELTDLDRTEMLLVLHSVICACEPLSEDVIASLSNLDSKQLVRAALLPFLSVLQVADSTGIVTTLHESFRDYLLDKSRSGRFHCNAEEHNTCLAFLCFNQISIPNPPFNICQLQSSYVFDEDLPGLAARINTTISEGLFYACRYWGAHLRLANYSQELADALHSFLAERLLLWVEVMNLKKRINDGMKIMYELEEWSQKRGDLADHIRALIQDGWKFVLSCVSSPVELSTPHIYVSVLPFWPENSPIAKCYPQRTPHVITESSTAVRVRKPTPLATIKAQQCLECFACSSDGNRAVVSSIEREICIWNTLTGQPAEQSLKGYPNFVCSTAFMLKNNYLEFFPNNFILRIWDVLTSRPIGQPLKGHTRSICSVAYSPDGKYIASGSEDCTIRIWDAHTGQPVGQPLEGHVGSVRSIAYSPNSKRITSGSEDRTIRIWDTRTGQPVGQPIEDHESSVISVAYSPNGQQIVSGSYDKTVRLRDAFTGQLLGRPLEGHTDLVFCVAYSPNGRYIVSGSQDQTIRIWDARTGQPVGQPLENPTGAVTSIAYSPNGQAIVSGSRDNIIHVWDAHADEVVYQPLEAHSDHVSSIAYSPDGEHIVSGSKDSTIRIWNALTGQPVGQPLKGHTDAVSSVAYSPDGQYIASGSEDKTIHVWSVLTGQLLGQPLKGHTSEVCSVAYSPNGKRIVSGSVDKTIRIWDALTGEAIGQPLEGHTDCVFSVSYSPNGQNIVSSSDGAICIWDALTGQLVNHLLQGYSSIVFSALYSPDGRHIVSCFSDGKIYIWDVLTGRPVGPLEGHTSRVYSVAYSPDGQRIVSGSRDGTVRIWDAITGQPVGQPLEGHTDRVHTVAYSPDGMHVASGSKDNTIRVWDLQPGRVISESIELQTNSSESSHTTTPISSAACSDAHICSSACQADGNHNAWALSRRGWVVTDDHKLLVWVPPDLRTPLVYPQNTIITSSRYGALYLDFDHRRIGEHWAEHFMPLKPSVLLTG